MNRPTSRWTSFVADRTAPRPRILHEEVNPKHRLRVEHNRETLLVHLSEEDGKGWLVLAVDRATRRWAVAQGLRRADTAAEAFDRVYPSPPALRVDHCVIHVSDWERSNRFYADVLGAEIVSQPGGRTAYRFGEQQLNVHGPGVDVGSLVARRPVQPGNSDLCFVWRGPIEAAVEHLAGHGVALEAGPVPRDGAAGRGTSVYFRDPDGSLLELLSYESG
jgi:catechol 2,3-dioxygenase-like lactoylglutathione lyase family enzyme